MAGSCRGGIEACDGRAVAAVALMKLVMVGAVAVGGEVVWW